MNGQARLIGIDIFRGWAITLMLIFHFSYDLQHFGYVNFNITTNIYWINFRLLIVSIFLITVGMSLKLTHKNKINRKAIKKRTFLLGIAALTVSFASYSQFPETWIYFGILHFIVIASLLLLPLLNYPKFSLFLAITVLISYTNQWISISWFFNLLAQPLHLPLYHTEDLVPLLPWIVFPLIGNAIIGLHWHQPIFNNFFFNQKNKPNKIWSFMGKHSLMIYLIHQPILFLLFLLITNK